MQVLHIILLIVGLVCYCAMTFFAVNAWFTLRRQHDLIHGTAKTVAKIFVQLSAMKIQSSFDKIEKMRTLLNALVENEDYEEAEKLKAAIAHAEEETQKSIDALSETCGVEIDMKVIKIGDSSSE